MWEFIISTLWFIFKILGALGAAWALGLLFIISNRVTLFNKFCLVVVLIGGLYLGYHHPGVSFMVFYIPGFIKLHIL